MADHLLARSRRLGPWLLSLLLVVACAGREASGSPSCGDNVVDADEVCDGTNVNGFSCTTLAAGFKSGTLACRSDCRGYDVSPCVRGNTMAALSCSQADVQAAVTAASDGDTVTIPAGNCSWSTPVVLQDRQIVLAGAGIDQTRITDATTTAWDQQPLRILCAQGKPFQITGLTLNSDDYAIDINGNCENFRVDHVKVAAIANGNTGVHTHGDTTGVIDHSTFVNVRILITGDDDASWSRPLRLGSGEFVFIEDCTFIGTPATNALAIDGQGGGRFVFRHNALTETFMMNHGRDSAGMRSTMGVEFYANSLVATQPMDTGIYLRGGTGVVFDNSFTGPYSNFVVTDYCSCYHHTPGYCQFDRCLTYPCMDQIGRSTDQILEPLYEWNNTINGADMDLAVRDLGCTNPSVSDHIQEGRDFRSDLEKPNYASYPYPHPIAVLSRIDGSVRRTGTTEPLAGVTVRAYTATGALAAQASTDALGHYAIALVPGTYFAIATNTLGGADQLYAGQRCAGCDPTTGNPIDVAAGATVANIDFSLDSPPAISIGDAVVKEGDSGHTTVTFTITLSKPGDTPATVDFATSGE